MGGIQSMYEFIENEHECRKWETSRSQLNSRHWIRSSLMSSKKRPLKLISREINKSETCTLVSESQRKRQHMMVTISTWQWTCNWKVRRLRCRKTNSLNIHMLTRTVIIGVNTNKNERANERYAKHPHSSWAFIQLKKAFSFKSFIEQKWFSECGTLMGLTTLLNIRQLPFSDSMFLFSSAPKTLHFWWRFIETRSSNVHFNMLTISISQSIFEKFIVNENLIKILFKTQFVILSVDASSVLALSVSFRLQIFYFVFYLFVSRKKKKRLFIYLRRWMVFS